MAALDAHSARTIDRHYALREPADDAALAKLLAKEVLGDTVPWPTDDEIEDDIKNAIDEDPDLDGELALVAIDDQEPDDDDLEHWSFGDFFGIAAASSLVPICDASEPQAHSISSSSATPQRTPRQNAGGTEEASSTHAKDKTDKSTPKDKKRKKDKKDAKRDLTAAKKRSSSQRVDAANELASLERALGRRSRLDPDTKAWLEKEHDGVKPLGEVAATKWFEEARQKGLDLGRIGLRTTAEGTRSHIRARARAAAAGEDID